MEKRIEGGGYQMDEDWVVPEPAVVPEPTVWPAVLAFGITLCGFGVLTSLLISLVGAGIFLLAATRWIGEMLHEQNDE